MPCEESKREKVKDIFFGLGYHCKELSSFVAANMADPYFQTTEGRIVARYAATIGMSYSMAMLALMDEKKKPETKNEDTGKKHYFTMEDMLMSMFNDQENKEDEEP